MGDHEISTMDYEGRHGHDAIGRFLEAVNIVKSDSMDITNDPRFFTDNVLNYRLAAFAGLSVVSGLMIQNAMDHVFDMDKRIKLDSAAGVCQAIAFFTLIVVLFLNVIATYVGVAQPYHTVRLMTAGPTGFEMATSYYLNKSIVVYRHLAVKSMLISLPLFMMQSGLRLIVKFKRENGHDEMQSLSLVEAQLMGGVSCAILMLMGFFVMYMDWKHKVIFQERFATLSTHPSMTAHMQSLMQPRATAMATGRNGFFHFPDV